MTIELLDEPTTALTVQDRAAVALGSSKTEQDLKALAVKNVSIVAIVDRPGREQAHGAAMELKRARTTVEKVSKAARDDATQFSKAVISEANRLIGIIEPEETRLLALRDGWDTEQERIKAEREAAERARITSIHQRISDIKSFHALAFECRTADRVQALLDKMEATWVAFDHEADFAEFGAEAQTAYLTTTSALTVIIDQKRADEAEREAIKAKQEAEAAKLKAEREAFEKQQEAARAVIKAEEDKRNAEYARWAKEQQDARKALEAEQAAFKATQAAAIAKEEAEQAARELAAYEAAIAVDTSTVRPVIDAAMKQIFGEAEEVPAVVAAPIPTAHEMIWVLARHYNVHSGQVAEWLTDCANEIANFE